MAEFTGIKPATKTTLFSCFVIIISTYLEAIGFLNREIYHSILPICSVGICTWLLLQPKSGTISDIAASIFGLFGLVVVLLGGWYFTIAITLLTYIALLEFFRMAEFTGIKPATKTTSVSYTHLTLPTKRIV